MTKDQLVAQTFGQLNECYSLSDISTGIGVSEGYILNLGLTQSPARSTMSDCNKKRDSKVFETLYYRLLSHYSSALKRQHNSVVIEEIKGKVIKLIDIEDGFWINDNQLLIVGKFNDTDPEKYKHSIWFVDLKANIILTFEYKDYVDNMNCNYLENVRYKDIKMAE